MAKTVLIPQTTFTAEESHGLFFYNIDDLLIDAEKITVVFDGVKYENLPVSYSRAENVGNELYSYGAPSNNGFDFSTYPFAIVSVKHTEDVVPQ